MRLSRIFKVLGVIAVLSMLMTALPAATALAANNIDLSQGEGSVGTSITVTGENFSPSTDTSEKWARVIFAADEATVSQNIDMNVKTYKVVKSAPIGFQDDPDEGEFEATFDIPSALEDGDEEADVTSGTYYIYVTITYSTGPTTLIRAVAEIDVTAGDIYLDVNEGPVDTMVGVTGESFASREDVVIEFDGDEVDIEDGDDQTDSSGDFESYFIVPESTAGDHDVTVTVGGTEVTAEFTVQPSIFINPQSGEIGTEVSISGTGYARRPKQVIVYFNNIEVQAVQLDTKGSFNTSFTVPENMAAGTCTVEAEDDEWNTSSAPFRLNAAPPPTATPTASPTPTATPTPGPSPISASLSQSTAAVGAPLVIGGSGFQPSATVTVIYDGTLITTSVASPAGILVASFNVPVSEHGAHTITLSDGVNTQDIEFMVESQPPQMPAPMLPQMGVKVKSPASFDWEDVIDESAPVTYSLQIATDDAFAESDIIIEKTDLAESEYTLSEKEDAELKAEATEAPYYWRVRATDAALNEGPWTGAGEFYVSTPFGIPSWALYTFMGIGAVLIFAIGYWLGRKTAFYY